jgi:sugar phosphate isomerase/epimerase
MSRKFYAMDTGFFHELGDYPLPVRCEMLKELGFDGTYLTLWDFKAQSWKDLEAIGEESSRHGLEVTGIYTMLDLDDTGERDRILQFVPSLPPGCALEIAIKSSRDTFGKSSDAGDDRALRLLEPLLKAVDPKRNRISLYAHINLWLERHQDAMRLIRKSGHPALGWVFSAYHWYASQEGQLFALLDEGIPHLHRVNMCGSRRIAEGNYTLEPIHSGTLDLPVIFGQIVKRGFAGPVGIQGFGVGGDVYENLKRGLSALRDWDQRFARHPHWADVLPPALPWFSAPGKGPLLTS